MYVDIFLFMKLLILLRTDTGVRKRSSWTGAVCKKFFNLSNLLGFAPQYSTLEIAQLKKSYKSNDGVTQMSFAPDLPVLISIQVACKFSTNNDFDCSSTGKDLTLCDISIKSTEDALIMLPETFRKVGKKYQIQGKLNTLKIERMASNLAAAEKRTYELQVAVYGSRHELLFDPVMFKVAGFVTNSSVLTCKRSRGKALEVRPILTKGDLLSCQLFCVGYGVGSGARKLMPVECLPEQFERPTLYRKDFGDEGQAELQFGEEFGWFEDFVSDTNTGSERNYLLGKYTAGSYRDGGVYCFNVRISRSGSSGQSGSLVTSTSGTCFELKRATNSFGTVLAGLLVFAALVGVYLFG